LVKNATLVRLIGDSVSMSDQEQSKDAYKAWRVAERNYRKQCREYFALVDASEPSHSLNLANREALATLTSLRESADAARSDYELTLRASVPE